MALAASAHKIRDDLFSISWNTTAPPPHQQKQISEVKNLMDVFKFCKLSFTRNGVNAVLEMEIQFSDTTKPIKTENIFVEVSKNGVKQKMTTSQTKWTASWIENCQYCHTYTQCSQCRVNPVASIFFEILIDLTPGSPKKTSQPLLDHLLNLWKTKTLADVKFQCDGKSIKAHTLILASGSPVLAAMFENDFKEKQERVVNITDIKANIFENLLQYIYTGEVALETEVEDAAELLIAADKYAVETLKEECAVYLKNDLKVENAARYLVIAHLHNSTVLHEATLQFMSENAKAVCSRKDWMDIIKNYPELCFQATQLMVGL
jgi:speckle-type POZ protein